MSGRPTEPARVISRIVPGYTDDRMAVRLRKADVIPIRRGLVLPGRARPLTPVNYGPPRRCCEPAIFAASHVVFACGKSPHAHAVQWALDRVAAAFILLVFAIDLLFDRRRAIRPLYRAVFGRGTAGQPNI